MGRSRGDSAGVCRAPRTLLAVALQALRCTWGYLLLRLLPLRSKAPDLAHTVFPPQARHLSSPPAAACDNTSLLPCLQPADSASPLHHAMVESAFSTVQAASQEAWDGLLQDLLQLYRSKLHQLDGTASAPATSATSRGGDGSARSSGDGGGGGGVDSGSGGGEGRPAGGPDLMLLSCSRLQALVVLCAGSPEARAAAEAQIVAVDPPSLGVPMSKASVPCGEGDWELRCFEMVELEC